ncbi:MAG: HD domain-containing phosphohydrolase, partial [Bacillota bacterium]|nr:HD domain-containing phosphohydrolase [Bacillota bacterium]
EQEEIESLRKQIVKLNAKLEEQLFLAEMTNILIKDHNLETIIKNTLQLAMDITGSEAGCLYIIDQTSNLKVVDVNGAIPDELIQAFSKINQLQISKELYNIIEVNHMNPLFESFAAIDNKLISFINIPLLVSNKIIGYAVVMHRREEGHNHSSTYSPKDLMNLKLFAHQAALLLENTRLKIEQGKHEAFLRTIGSLISAMDAKDIYTQNHSQRVAKMTVHFSKFIGLEEKIIEKFHFGALLHDIGKIGVSDIILNKPTFLEEKEFDRVKEHPIKGSMILAPMEPDIVILDIIKHHHERYDGQGYPTGLVGEKIPFAARLVSIVDAWDAMTSNRSYRKRLSQDRTLKELEKGKGTQFDPILAKEFISFIKNNDVNSLLIEEQNSSF